MWFYRANPEKYEAHWDVYSGGELWRCYGGKNNLFYAIALFFHHLKSNMDFTFGHHNYKELINKLLR